MSWNPIETVPRDGTPVLVYLESKMLGTRVHSASFHPNIARIGGCFEFDAPKATHWMLEPKAPEERNHHPSCASLNRMLLVDPPRPAQCDCHLASQNTSSWICKSCGTDRLKAECPRGHSAALTGQCPMVAKADLSENSDSLVEKWRTLALRYNEERIANGERADAAETELRRLANAEPVAFIGQHPDFPDEQSVYLGSLPDEPGHIPLIHRPEMKS